MAFRSKSPDSDSPGGLRSEFRAFLGESSRHLRTRGELLALEAREAAAISRRRFLLSGAGFAALALGYLIICGGLIGLLGSLFDGSPVSLANWRGAALLIGALHLPVALLVLRKARQIKKDGVLFEHTLNEIRKDQECLNREKKN